MILINAVELPRLPSYSTADELVFNAGKRVSAKRGNIGKDPFTSRLLVVQTGHWSPSGLCNPLYFAKVEERWAWVSSKVREQP